VGDTLRQRATVVETALALHPAETPAPAEPAPARSRLKRYLND
jgi:hypothetical protein